MKHEFILTSESVTGGHPDKLCDQIADAVVDHFLLQDPYAQVVSECAVAKGILFIATRFAGQASVDVPFVARQVIQQEGYDDEHFNARDCAVMSHMQEQAPDYYRILPRVDERTLDDAAIDRIPAQSLANVFGFACNQTPALMPLPIWLAHKLARRLAQVRSQGPLPYLTPDGKVQVAVEYHKHKPARIHSITLVACQREANEPHPTRLRDDLIEQVIRPVFDDEAVRPDNNTHLFINPEGPRLVGGPSRHSGLTGRKSAVDTYGEYARHGGSALSGKDPLRIDRVGAYVARYAAKNVVAAGLAKECEVMLAYSIGLAQPVSIRVDTFDTGKVPDDEIAKRLSRFCDFRPAAIVRDFALRRQPGNFLGGFYRQLAAYGQVGRTDIVTPWENTEGAEQLKDK
jgi:S-adenosylmethionine synthetase